jgi:CDP-diacylglycerol--glycerol-3-phosphate 3-phosphatidyltransferase
VTDRSFVTDSTRQRIRGWAVPIALAMGRLGLTPNALTVLGFLGTCAAALAAAVEAWVLAGGLVLAFGIFDLFDGALARATGKASRFGAFLDSTLDRTGENLVYAGVAVGASQAQIPTAVIGAVLAMAFASVVTYTRAKAEVVGLKGDIGVAPRPERLVILAIGLILAGIPGGVLGFGQGWLAIALAIIAALSAITVLQRILHVKAQLDRAQGDQ